MRSRTLGVRLFLLLLAPALLGVQRPDGLGDVQDVRFWSYPDYTRVVIEVTRPVPDDPHPVLLSADPRAGRPRRLFVDLPRIWVGRRYQDGIAVSDGLLKGVRLGQNTLETTRVVVDLEHYDRHRILRLSAPHRLVIDVYGARDEPQTTRWPVDRSHLPRLPFWQRHIETVVIDPGHGGRDPGAVGRTGLREKDVNLRLSLHLAEKLRDSGFRVALTRDDDRTLSLEERTAIAESAAGDLFVSIHANASRERATRGLEIYHLDESHQRHSLRVAARENGVSRSDMDSLQRTLARLRASESSQHGSRLASSVHGALTQLIGRHAGFEDHGIKQGPFYVLFLSSMPAILLESGFITNAQDAELLRNERFLEAMAEHIARGLREYRDSAPLLLSGAGG